MKIYYFYIASGNAASSSDSNCIYTSTNDCYQITITDLRGDGIGNYQIIYETNTLISTNFVGYYYEIKYVQNGELVISCFFSESPTSQPTDIPTDITQLNIYNII